MSIVKTGQYDEFKVSTQVDTFNDVKGTDVDNKVMFEMKYCANHGGRDECKGSDWFQKVTDLVSGEDLVGTGGSFNTSDDPQNGIINGSFVNGPFSGRFKFDNMTVINHGARE